MLRAFLGDLMPRGHVAWSEINRALTGVVSDRRRRWALVFRIFTASVRLPDARAMAGLMPDHRNHQLTPDHERGMRRVGIIIAYITLEICRVADLPLDVDGCMDLTNPELLHSGWFPWGPMLLPVPEFVVVDIRRHQEACAQFRAGLSIVLPAEILDRICCYAQEELHKSVPHRPVDERLRDELGGHAFK
jgi:hypothetical protein